MIFASWCIYVYLLAFTSSPDKTKSTCTVERLFAFTPNHLLVRHNYFLHNLQLFADFDFSVLQRVKVANSGRDSLLGPRLVQKTEFWAQTRPLPADWARGHTKIKILIKHCDKRKLKMCKFMIVQVIFFVANLKPFD